MRLYRLPLLLPEVPVLPVLWSAEDEDDGEDAE